MSVHGPLCEPYTVMTIESIEPMSYGDLVELFVMEIIEGVVGVPITNRFPTPPIAWGFLTDDPEDEFVFDGLGPPYDIRGALFPESPFLEPTIGQIWPRIG